MISYFLGWIGERSQLDYYACGEMSFGYDELAVRVGSKRGMSQGRAKLMHLFCLMVANA